MPMKQQKYTYGDLSGGTLGNWAHLATWKHLTYRDPIVKKDENLSMEHNTNANNISSDKKPVELDPTGRDLKAGGAKADAGKAPIVRGCLHYFPRAITAVSELSLIGAKKYSWKGWESVPDGVNRYGDALGRHELRIEGDYTRRDGDTGVLEATAVAWNALARLELILRENEKKVAQPGEWKEISSVEAVKMGLK